MTDRIDQFDPRPLHYSIELDGDVLYDGIAAGVPQLGDVIVIATESFVVLRRTWECYVGFDSDGREVETTDLSVLTIAVKRE